MSEQVTLASRPRAGAGKSEAKSLRREGRVPAIVYGTGIEATPVSVDARELFHALRTDAGANAVLALDIDGDRHIAMAREITRHPVRRDILHVDFVTVNRNVTVTVDVPIVLEGADNNPATGEGGVITQDALTAQVEVLPLEVPDQLVFDVSNLAVGDVARLGDLQLPEGVTLVEDPEKTLVSVVVPTLEMPEDTQALDSDAAEAQAAGATADEATGDAEG
jgi:large subunit ribosomal protein L25